MTQESSRDTGVVPYSLGVDAHRQEIADALQEGEVVGVQNGSVVALCASPDAASAMQDMKGEARGSRPVGLTALFGTLAVKDVIDYKRLDKSLRPLVDPDSAMTDEGHELDRRFGGFGFIRLPARMNAVEEAGIPPCALSFEQKRSNKPDYKRPVIQNYSPFGHDYITDLILTRSGIEHPVITSMNESGEPEIVTADEARKFARAKGIKFIADPATNLVQQSGSYPIVVMGDRLEITRSGNLPAWVTGKFFEPHGAWMRACVTAPQKGRKALEVDPRFANVQWQIVRKALIRQLGWNTLQTPVQAKGGGERIISEMSPFEGAEFYSSN